MARSSPYQGLQPFGGDDVAFFGGRGRDVRLIVASLFASRLTLLYGPSGVGKSSVLHAGAVPQLEQRRSVLVVGVREWSQDPVRSLSEAVARAAGVDPGGDLTELVQAASGPERLRVMLVLDQFEHALAEDADGGLVDCLATALLHPGLAVSAVVAIREDALAELDRFEGRLPGIFDTALRLAHLDRDAGARAIRDPLRAWERETGERVEVEDALVDAVLDAVPAGRAATGVDTAQLQLVMTRVWEAERAAGSSLLRERTFSELGGAHGIVRAHVRDALDAMPAADRDLAAVVLDRLVTPSGARIAHLTGDLAGYAGSDAATVRPVLERLSAARVLRPVTAAGTGGARFEVYHELVADAVLAWLTAHEADRREAIASARLRKRVASLVVVAAIAVVVAVVLAGALIDEKRSSEEARSGAISATARRLLAGDGDPQLALALALRAADERPTRESELALRAALSQSFERDLLRGPGGGVASVDVGGDGRSLLTTEADGRVRLWDRKTHRLVRTLPAAEAVTAAFCPDARRVVVGGDRGAALIAGTARIGLSSAAIETIACSADGTRIAIREPDRARVFDARDGRLVASLPTMRGDANAGVALSADGARIAVLVPGAVDVLDVRGGRRSARLRTGQAVSAVAFSPDGARLVTGGAEGAVTLWDLRRRSVTADLAGNASFVFSVAYSPDGALVVSGSADSTARVWDAASGVALAELRGHVGRVEGAAFASDSRTVATAGEDGTFRLWALPIGAALRSADDIVDGFVSRDGRRVVTATNGGTVAASDARTGRRTARVDARGAVRVAVAPDGGRVAVIESSGHVRSWDPARPDAPAQIASERDAVFALDFSADGRTIALAGDGGIVRVVAPGGRLVRVLRLPGVQSPGAIAFSPDDRRIAVVDPLALQIVVVDARSGRQVRRIRPGEGGLTTIDFSPDGSQLIAGSDDGARIWDARTGRLRLQLRGHRAAVASATFSSRGELVATAGGGEARVWDADSGDLLAVLAGETAAFGDGTAILTTEGRVARLHPCDACGDLDTLTARGRERLTRRFTEHELSAAVDG